MHPALIFIYGLIISLVLYLIVMLIIDFVVGLLLQMLFYFSLSHLRDLRKKWRKARSHNNKRSNEEMKILNPKIPEEKKTKDLIEVEIKEMEARLRRLVTNLENLPFQLSILGYVTGISYGSPRLHKGMTLVKRILHLTEIQRKIIVAQKS